MSHVLCSIAENVETKPLVRVLLAALTIGGLLVIAILNLVSHFNGVCDSALYLLNVYVELTGSLFPASG